jgi:hypothetical protein
MHHAASTATTICSLPVPLSCLCLLLPAVPLAAAAGPHTLGWRMPLQQRLLLHRPDAVPLPACEDVTQTAPHSIEQARMLSELALQSL